MNRTSLLFAGLLALSVCASAEAATYTWAGGYPEGPEWNTSTSWTSSNGGTTYPGGEAGDTAVFNLTPTNLMNVNMDGFFTISTLTLSGAGPMYLDWGYQNGNTLTVANPIQVGNSQTLYTYWYGTMIYGSIQMTGTATLGDNGTSWGAYPYEAPSKNLDVTGSVSYSGSGGTLAGLTLTGTLTVASGATLNVNNPYEPVSATTTLVSGTLNGVDTPGAVTGAGGHVVSSLGGSVSLTGGTLWGDLIYTGTVTSNGADTITGGTFNSLAVSATGNLSVNGAITGNVAVNGGVLRGTGTITGPVSLTGGTLAGALTYAGNVSSNGTDTIGGGTFNSTLTVNSGGKLSVNCTVAPTGVTVNTGGVLQGAGTINQAIALSGTLGGTLSVAGNVASTGGTLSPGSGGNGSGHVAGTLAITGGNSLSLDSAGALTFNLGSATAYSDQISVGGTVSLGGATLNLYNLGGMAPGAYTLMTYANTANPGTLSIPVGQVTGLNYTDTITPTSVTLNVVSGYAYTWSGAGSIEWNDSNDWTSPNGGTAFPGGGSDVAVFNLHSWARPESYFDGNYTIGTMVLNGSGPLYISWGNLGGTLTVTNPIQVGDSQTLYMYNGGTMLDGSIQMTGAATLGDNGTTAGTYWEMAPYHELYVTGNVSYSGSGGTLAGLVLTGTLNVAGGATLNVNNPYEAVSATAVVVSGTLNGVDTPGADQLGGNVVSELDGPVSLMGGTLSGDLIYSGAVTSNGTDTISGGTFNSTLTVNGTGNLSVVGVTIAPTSVSVNGGGVLRGTGTINAPVALTGGTLSGSVTYNGAVASNGVDTISGGTLNSSLTVNGAGNLSVNGLTIAPTNVTVNSGGVLQGTGTINPQNSSISLTGGTLSGSLTLGASVSASSASTLSPGSGGNGSGHSCGTLTINGAVTLDHSTTLNFNLGPAGTTGSNDNDFINITGPLSLDGTLNVNALGGFGVGTYTLIDYSGALSGAGLTLGAAPGLGLNYAIDTTTTDEINLVVTNSYSPADTNHDGLVNSLDIDAIYQNLTVAPSTYIGTWPRQLMPYQAQYDVNGDGAVTQADVTYELNHYFHTSYGDSNLDRATDFGDFQTLLNHWQASGPTIGWAQADFNGDGVVDFLDFQILLNYWNPGGWNYAPSQTPEPASMTLILLGGLALLRRKK
jgi:hypothetical protein